jgi:hypothetical protein
VISYTTFEDVLNHGLDYLGAASSAQALRDCRRAALEAYRDLANAHNWSYLYTHGRIITNGMYDSTVANSTLQYAQSGGTYPRMATISGDVWPTWAAGSYIRCQAPTVAPENSDAPVDLSGVVAYKVVERISATVVVLDGLINPGFDIAAGTPFQIYRDTYLLPEDYIAQDQALFERNFGGMSYTHPREWLYENRYVFAQGVPQMYTITGDNLYPGRLVIKIYPWPYETRSIDFIYKRRPRPLLLESDSAGSVSITGGSVSLNGTGTVFTTNMVGSVIRLAANGLKPPSSLIMGGAPTVLETFVKDWVSPTAVNLEDPARSTLSNVAYTISDMVDIEQGAMLNAYFRCVEKHLGMNRTLKDKPSAAAQFTKALAEAKDADSRSFTGRSVSEHRPLRRRLRDYPINLGSTE